MVWCFVLCLSVWWYQQPLNNAILLLLCLTLLNTLLLTGLFANWYYKCPITTLPTFFSQGPNQCPWTKWAIGVEEEKTSSSGPFCSVSSVLCSTSSPRLVSWLPSCSFLSSPSLRHWEECQSCQSRHGLGFFFQISYVTSECLNLFHFISRRTTQQLHLRSWRHIVRILIQRHLLEGSRIFGKCKISPQSCCPAKETSQAAAITLISSTDIF